MNIDFWHKQRPIIVTLGKQNLHVKNLREPYQVPRNFNTEIGSVDKAHKNSYCTRHLIGLPTIRITNIHLSVTVYNVLMWCNNN